MSKTKVTARLPLKIKISGGLVQSVTDADGHPIECAVWDKDTEGVDLDSPHLKTDEEGDEFYVYEI